MDKDGVVQSYIEWNFLWRTSLGSKPCSDSCLVIHLNKFNNPVPASEVEKNPLVVFSLAPDNIKKNLALQNSLSVIKAQLWKLHLWYYSVLPWQHINCFF